MSYTPVQNRFWSDGWVRQLNALDRYLFLYLLTNGRAELTGIYELPLDLMASESGIDEKDLRMSMLLRLEPKVYYKEGWVIIVNYPNHRVSNSPKLLAGIRNRFDELPKKIQEISLSYGYPIDTVSIHIPVSRNRIDKIRIEENRKDNISVAIAPQVVEISEEEERPKKVSRAKYPHSKEVFALFGRYPKSWERDTTQLTAAEALYNERGVDEIKNALAWFKDLKGREFCPQVNTPRKLDTKWEDFEKFVEKQEV